MVDFFMVPKSRKACGAVSSLSIHGLFLALHPGRLTWNLQITRLERNMIFQTSMRTCSMLIFRGVKPNGGVILITYFILGAHRLHPFKHQWNDEVRKVIFSACHGLHHPTYLGYGTVLGTNKPV